MAAKPQPAGTLAGFRTAGNRAVRSCAGAAISGACEPLATHRWLNWFS